jgi:hypothetical protein
MMYSYKPSAQAGTVNLAVAGVSFAGKGKLSRK